MRLLRRGGKDGVVVTTELVGQEVEAEIGGNEVRAHLGLVAVESTSRRTGVWSADPAVTAFENCVRYIAHSCDRYGLPPGQVVRDGLRRYRQDLESATFYPPVADGNKVTLEEVFRHASY